MQVQVSNRARTIENDLRQRNPGSTVSPNTPGVTADHDNLKGAAVGVLEEEESSFECGICLAEASGPVVTLCGHLYCWSCLHKWMLAKKDIASCPVCKSWLGTMERPRLVPIYAKGEADDETQTRNEDGTTTTTGVNVGIPPRPKASFAAAPPPGPDGRPIQNSWLGWIVQALDLNHHTGDTPLSYEQQHQNFLSMLLLFLGSFVILCLLIL